VAYISVNPATGKELARFELHDAKEVERRLDVAHAAFLEWRSTSFEHRGALMHSAASLLDAELPDVASLLTKEMGKTFAAAKGEVAKCAMAMHYYADHAEGYLATEHIATSGAASGVRYEPLGAVLAVMPWNFPLWQVVRFAAPSLMAGNVGVLKHASNVPQTAQFLEQLFRRGGFPDGIFTNLFAPSDAIADVIADDRIAAVTLTGSERAGRAVASAAGRALKKSVLELGGSDPFVVAHSADLDRTVPLAVTARIQNNGQSCIASKRFIVVASRADEFLERFTAAMDAVVMGDPFDPATVLGPVVSSAQRDELAQQVADSLDKGATATTGGVTPTGEGYFYPATVLTGVDPTMRAGCEELFGPVAGGPGGRRPGRRRPGRRHRPRERLAVGTRLVDLGGGCHRAAARHRGARGGDGLRQLRGRLDARAALRRHQALRLRPRAEPPRHPRVHEREDVLRGRLVTSAAARRAVARVGGDQLYFDHAASAPRRPEVLEAMAQWTTGVVGNPTGSHRAARAARAALDDAREEVAELTGSIPGGVVFTAGGTESCNLAVFGVAADRTRRGHPARLVVSAIEHHAVADAAGRLARGLLAMPVEVAHLPVTTSGVVDVDAVGELLDGAHLMSVMTANNEVGTVQPIPELAALAREASPDVVVHTDAIAAAPWLDLRDAARGADLVSVCAHKLGGPVGSGALCLRRELPLAPLVVGGGQERGRRAGTPDVAAAVGLAAALRCAARDRVAAVTSATARRDHLAALLVAHVPGTRLTAGDVPRLPGTCHVTIEGVASEELVFLCDEAGLCVSAASSCASGAAQRSHVLAAMGMDDARSRSSLRLTLGEETTDEDVVRAATIVADAVAQLRSAPR
jgi:succinate-semialdehyde dehydrogenase/glutarate-semialdehyde dehydrogenase